MDEHDFLLDSGATCAITTDPNDCYDLQPCNVTVKVGGGYKMCTMTGRLKARHPLLGGKYATVDTVCRVIPTFSIKLFPEAFWLQKNCTMVKHGDRLRAVAPDGAGVGLGHRKRGWPLRKFYTHQETVRIFGTKLCR